MFNFWLKLLKQSASSNLNSHEILGIPLNSPLSSFQEEILFGCGCFWGAEKSFWKLPGVINTAVGYSGGQTKNPTYNQVCSGNSGHSEVVRVVWDTRLIDISDLLKMFWECHDPTQGNSQGNDHGTQYRSTIYTTNPSQMKIVLASKLHYQNNLKLEGFSLITTEIKADQIFYFAEAYHQQYLAKPGSRQYCSASPTKVKLGEFEGCNYKLGPEIWSQFDWNIPHCVLRSDNSPIITN